ncbi:MAG: flagellar basal-body MS-ring/collar protein FliF [Pseudomonadota bacterium]
MEANANQEVATTAPAPQVQLGNVLAIPAVRQLGSLVGVALSIAIGFWLVLWSRSPDTVALYTGLEESDKQAVVGTLRSAGIEFDMSEDGSTILVATDRLQDARLQLAAEGLPASSGGMDSVGQDSGFGVSQFIETAKYRHALEAELSRTIKSMRTVKDARVHLAIPKETAFIRDKQTPTASVMLQLYGGQRLEDGQAEAIVNLVAGSISGMRPEDVTVADQYGRLLSGDGDGDEQMQELSGSELAIKRDIERDYRSRIEDLLAPMIGVGNVRAQVDVDLDFTVVEETRERFNPENSVIRSEYVEEQERKAGEGIEGGVPGALTNTPPEAGGIAPGTEAENVAEMIDSSRSATRNFELDRTISRTRSPSYQVRRLAVAVLIDETAFGPQADTRAAEDAPAGDQSATDEPETVTTQTVALDLTPEMLSQIESLAQNAVGFNAARGDTVAVVAAPFRTPAAMEPVQDPPIWEQPAIRDLIKQGLAVVLALVIGFGILRPALKKVLTPVETAGVPGLLDAPNAALATVDGVLELPGAQTGGLTYQDKVDAARNITGHDPARVAQVVRKWIDNDGE